MISIIECLKCKEPQVFRNASIDSDIPVALSLTIEGGYMMFIDPVFMDKSQLEIMLCHKCAHDFTRWLGIPEETITKWHPKTEEEYCDGWKL